MSPLHVRSRVCIAPFHVRGKFCEFAPHMDGRNADFARHTEESHADFVPHMERRHSFRNQIIAKIVIFWNFQKLLVQTTFCLWVFMTYVIIFRMKIFWGRAPLIKPFCFSPPFNLECCLILIRWGLEPCLWIWLWRKKMLQTFTGRIKDNWTEYPWLESVSSPISISPTVPTIID